MTILILVVGCGPTSGGVQLDGSVSSSTSMTIPSTSIRPTDSIPTSVSLSNRMLSLQLDGLGAVDFGQGYSEFVPVMSTRLGEPMREIGGEPCGRTTHYSNGELEVTFLYKTDRGVDKGATFEGYVLSSRVITAIQAGSPGAASLLATPDGIRLGMPQAEVLRIRPTLVEFGSGSSTLEDKSANGRQIFLFSPEGRLWEVIGLSNYFHPCGG